MKWTAQIQTPKPLQFIIERQSFTDMSSAVQQKFYGYYLYVYDNGKNTHDYLQDTFEIAVDQAYEDFGVPKDAWQEVTD